MTQHTLHERTMHLTQIESDKEEIDLLNLGMNYAIEKPISRNMKQLIIETEQAISQLHEQLRNGYRIIAHKRFKQILHDKHNPLHIQQNRILKRIRHKLQLNNLTLVQVDKGKNGLDMCYSMHFYKVLINTPTNAQLMLLYNDMPTCFDPLGSSSGLYIEYQKLQIKMCIKYL
jgi:uncharacterized protein YlaN (UPF0358 family)